VIAIAPADILPENRWARPSGRKLLYICRKPVFEGSY
jgi:hypothetical protein